MGDSFERIGYNQLNHKLKITGGGLEVSSGNISGSISSTGSFGYISIDGTALPETIADTVGAMVGSNTETGIGVTYQDGDNTLDFALDAAQTTITSLFATDIKIGEDDQTKIDFGTTNEIRFAADNQVQFKLVDGGIIPLSDSDVDLGTTSARFKDAYVDSITVTGNIRSAGDIIAENYIVSSSVTYMTQSFSSGSTIFGDDSDDLHKFTGSLNISGSFNVKNGNAEFAGNVSGSSTSTGSFGYISIGGTALPETIADTVGAMVGSNTETGISVSYQDGDNTLDFALDAAQTTITSLLATDIKIGEDDQTKIDFGTTNEIRFAADNQVQFKLVDGGIVPLSDSDLDLGTTSARFKDAYVDSITVTHITASGNISASGTVYASKFE